MANFNQLNGLSLSGEQLDVPKNVVYPVKKFWTGKSHAWYPLASV